MSANERDITTEGTARFVIVLICGKLPTKITGDIKEEYGFLRSISHLGISLNSRDEVAHRGDGQGRGLPVARPDVRNEVVGYICVVTDPDGNTSSSPSTNLG